VGLAAEEADLVVADMVVAGIGAAVAAIGVVVGDADDEENDYGKSSIF